ncbi:DUF3052 family protein [Piscinibacter defluvii]|uniref:DUF3052 family protein n=1 Tax=Piscinibacter defluvii TaxID=1796922 RepID=UPI000FDF1FC9|nr:DUF3052 family protein [Piscinibacter defluvii]
MPVGYSGTPLPKKLGLTDNTYLLVLNEPQEYESLLGTLPSGLERQNALSRSTNVVHVFVTKRQELSGHLATLRKKLNAEAAVWVSWPKKSSKIPSDVTEDVIRELALPLGFVDIKICAVSEVWSGLKLTVRKQLRNASEA